LALLGGDIAVFTKAASPAAGYKLPPRSKLRTGAPFFSKSQGNNVPRYLVLVESQIKLPKGDTIAIKDSVMRLARHFHSRGLALRTELETARSL
jgi:hypothetical protein